MLGDATEQCALKVGQTLGGLLNATFGSEFFFIIMLVVHVQTGATLLDAVEAIVGILALSKGELRIVQTSMLGSILSNLLLVLGQSSCSCYEISMQILTTDAIGCSFLAAGTRVKEATFQTTAAQTSSSMMVLACTTLIVPAAYHASRIEKPTPGMIVDILGSTSLALCFLAVAHLTPLLQPQRTVEISMDSLSSPEELLSCVGPFIVFLTFLIFLVVDSPVLLRHL